jgi:uncharacterized protein
LTIEPLNIIQKFYKPGTQLYNILVNHSKIVTEKSLEMAEQLPHLKPDTNFIKNAAMLHDIGIFLTRSESIGCTGDAPYICHGYLGRHLLDELGFLPEYGLVSERHTGAGITKENIISNKLPLPARDMVPISIEEKLICMADKYHSKSPHKSGNILTTAQVIEELATEINQEHAQRFSDWMDELGTRIK